MANTPAGQEWPADQVSRRPIADLVPYARNARTHSPLQVDQLAASIREWGWTMPVLVDEAGQLIAGHGRVMAAQKLDLVEVPVMVARGWSDAKKRAYVLADNKLALNAGWDADVLKLELADLQDAEFTLDLVGFSEKELGELLGEQMTSLGGSDPGLGDGFKYQVVVDCRDEADQGLMLEKLKGEGRECRPLTL